MRSAGPVNADEPSRIVGHHSLSPSAPGRRDARHSLYWRSGRNSPPDVLRGQPAEARASLPGAQSTGFSGWLSTGWPGPASLRFRPAYALRGTGGFSTVPIASRYRAGVLRSESRNSRGVETGLGAFFRDSEPVSRGSRFGPHEFRSRLVSVTRPYGDRGGLTGLDRAGQPRPYGRGRLFSADPGGVRSKTRAVVMTAVRAGSQFR